MKLTIDTNEDVKSAVLAAVEAIFGDSTTTKVDKQIAKEAKKNTRKEDKPKEPTIKATDVKNAVKAYRDQYGQVGVEKILEKYGVKIANDIDKSRWAELLVDLSIED
jgi:hypothetical protein